MKKLNLNFLSLIFLFSLFFLLCSWQWFDKGSQGLIAEKSKKYCFTDQGELVYPSIDFGHLYVCLNPGKIKDAFLKKFPELHLAENAQKNFRKEGAEVFSIKEEKALNRAAAMQILEKIRADENVKSVYPCFLIKGQMASTDNVLIINASPEKDVLKEIEEKLASFQGVIRDTIYLGPTISYMVDLPKAQNVFQIANSFDSQQGINYAQPNFIFTGKNHFVPSDLHFADQWYLDQESDADIDAPEAWDCTRASANEVVALIDATGFKLTHDELERKMVSPYCAVNDNNEPIVQNSLERHGTLCAGVAAATSNNEKGVASIGFHSRLMPIRIGYDFVGNQFTTSSEIILRAAQHILQSDQQIVAVSNSFGLGVWANTDPIRQVYESMRTQCRSGLGAVVLASTGDDTLVSQAQYPCFFPNVIGVGASDQYDNRAVFSNYGDSCDLVAPGVDIYSTDYSNHYEYFSGTSAACPMAAGVVSLIASIYPDWTSDQLAERLCRSCDKVGSYTFMNMQAYPFGTWNNEMGYGRINAFQAVGASSAGLEMPSNFEAVAIANNASLRWKPPLNFENFEHWLKFHDNTFENAFASHDGGQGLAQAFVLDSVPAILKTVRFFVSNLENYYQPLDVYILNDDGSHVIAGPFIQNGICEDWLSIDVGSILLTNPGFMVAAYTTLTDGPYIGVDNSQYIENLYFGNHIDGFTELGLWGHYYVGSFEALVEYQVGAKAGTSEVIKPGRGNVSKSQIDGVELKDKAEMPRLGNRGGVRNNFMGYNIYRDGVKLNQDIFTDTCYGDYLLNTGTYNYAISAVYEEGESELSQMQEVEIFNELLRPPGNFIVTNTHQDVSLSWEVPGNGGGFSELIRYDDDLYTGTYKYLQHAMSIHFTPKATCKLLQLQFFTLTEFGENNFNAMVFNWDEGTPGNDILFESSCIASNSAWTVLDLISLNINIDGEFLVGFNAINSKTTLAFDENINNGRAWDYGLVSAEWTPWNEAYLIRALVQYNDGALEALGLNTKNSDSNDWPGKLLGYNIYRDGLPYCFTENTFYEDVLPAPGTYAYKIRARYDEGESASVGPVSVTWNSGFGIDENELSQNISLAPNPAKDQVFISSPEIINEIRVYNLQFQLVKQESIQKENFKVNVGQLKPGIYFINFYSAKSLAVKKFVVN
jgi:Subtilase family/Secretion system C-terminal sorting domain